MTPNVTTVNKTNSLSDVVEIFNKHHIHHIPVVSGDQLIGMISRSDIDRVSFVSGTQGGEVSTAVYEMLDLEQVMTKNLVSVETDTEIRDVVEILSKSDFHALPVTENGKMAGIVTTHDLLNFLKDLF